MVTARQNQQQGGGGGGGRNPDYSKPPATQKNTPYVTRLQGGQTWKDISERFDIDVDQLKRLNPDIKMLQNQDEGFLRLRRTPRRVETREGDTWRRLARRYGMTAEELRELNPNLVAQGPLRGMDAGTRVRTRARPGVQNSLDPWAAIDLDEQRYGVTSGAASSLADINFNRGMENLRYSQTRQNVLNKLSRGLEDLATDRQVNMTRLIDSLGARGLTGSGVADRFRGLAAGGFDLSEARQREDTQRALANYASENLAQNLGFDAQAAAALQNQKDLLDQLAVREALLRSQGAVENVSPGDLGS